MSPVDEESYVGLYGSYNGDHADGEGALGYAAEVAGGSARRERSTRARIASVSACCTAAILLLGAALISGESYYYFLPAYLTGSASSTKEVFNEVGEDGFFQGGHTGYHFQTNKYWMADPNAPLYYKGLYHFFYQFNPKGSVWGNVVWGHAVSSDMIHWTYLEDAIISDKWYDVDGVWSGSATILEDGTPVFVYTGGRNQPYGVPEQTLNVAYPVDPSDPLLRGWKKDQSNPILRHPPGVIRNDFRDPSSAWMEADGYWRMTVGVKTAHHNASDTDNITVDGFSVLYKSKDFGSWELEPTVLHKLQASGMWECVELFPIEHESTNSMKSMTAFQAENYIDSYTYVLKASMWVYAHDHYVIGTYSSGTHTFTPMDPTLDLLDGPRCDYGKFYASKSFFDSSTGRRIVWGWANESDTTSDDLLKEWASVQCIPRVLWLDPKTNKNLLVWPVEEVDSLRESKFSRQDVILQPTDVVKVSQGPQLDIVVDFEKPNMSGAGALSGTDLEERFICGGSSQRGTFGPFGLLVHTDDKQREQTSIFFVITRSEDESWVTTACSDQSRSTKASGVDLTSYGSPVTVLPDEDILSMRILVDHSILETFLQGGRQAITARAYPTFALGSNAGVFLFNNGTTPVRVKNLDIYQMRTVRSAPLRS